MTNTEQQVDIMDTMKIFKHKRVLLYLVPIFVLVPVLFTWLMILQSKPYLERIMSINYEQDSKELTYYGNTLANLNRDPFNEVQNQLSGGVIVLTTRFLTIKAFTPAEMNNLTTLIDTVMVRLIEKPEAIREKADVRLKEIQKIALPDTAIPPLYREYIDLKVEAASNQLLLEHPENRYTVLLTRQVHKKHIMRSLLIGFILDCTIFMSAALYLSTKKETSPIKGEDTSK